MEKNTRTKNILLIVLLVAVLTLSISYALLSQTLTITSQAVVKGKNTTWNVKFTDALCTAHGYAVVNNQFSPTETTSLSGLSMTFKAPGDYVTCAITVSNLGAIDATLADFTLQSGTFSYSGTGATQAADEALAANLITTSIVYATGDADAGKVPHTTTGTAQENTNDDLPAPVSPATSVSRNLTLTFTLDGNKTLANLPTNDVTITGFETTFVYNQD